MSKRKSVLDGRWSKKWPRCIECGRTEFAHVAHGVCRNCVLEWNRRRDRAMKENEKKYYQENKREIDEYRQSFMPRPKIKKPNMKETIAMLQEELVRLRAQVNGRTVILRKGGGNGNYSCNEKC